ncbi:MAG: bifunctional 2-polyprenyl-6-hydroxyphenol methylase/3-demethylubiquinol 3-O-methyltransferase UbiG, partial [Bacteroidota bacterium]
KAQSPKPVPSVNNAFYDHLGETWYEGDDHAIALLRAEMPLKVGFVFEQMTAHDIEPGARILDVACGGGLVTFPLAEAGYSVHGVDLSEGSIEAARGRTPANSTATFAVGDAYALEAEDASFDVVLLLDMLEHVERPADVLAEAARVVRPGGLVMFNTFNSTPLAWLLAVHGFKFIVRDAPEHIHVFDLFIAPSVLAEMGADAGLQMDVVRGVRPALGKPFWWSLRHRRIHPDFQFRFTASPAVGYMGCLVREPATRAGEFAEQA